MRFLLTDPYASLDCETTSANPEEAQVVDIALALIRPGEQPELRSATVDPGVEVPDEAAKIHGFTTERVRAEGKPAPEVLDGFLSDIAAVVRDGWPLLIQNAPYDATVLDHEAARHHLEPLASRLGGAPLHIVDTLCLDKRLIKFRKRVSPTQGARQLKTLAAVYGIPWDDALAHGAGYDAMQAARVGWRMAQWCSFNRDQLAALRVGPFDPPKPMHRNDVAGFLAVGRMSPAELHAAQVGWAREQADNFADWLRQNAHEALHRSEVAEDDAEREIFAKDAADLFDKANGVSGEWPVRSPVATS